MAFVGEKPLIAGGRTLAKMRRGKSVTNNKDKPSRKKVWFTGPTLVVKEGGKMVGIVGNTWRKYGSWTGQNPYIPQV